MVGEVVMVDVIVVGVGFVGFVVIVELVVVGKWVILFE